MKEILIIFDEDGYDVAMKMAKTEARQLVHDNRQVMIITAEAYKKACSQMRVAWETTEDSPAGPRYAASRHDGDKLETAAQHEAVRKLLQAARMDESTIEQVVDTAARVNLGKAWDILYTGPRKVGREAFEAITAYTAEAIIEDKQIPFPTFSEGERKFSRKIKPAWGHTEGLQRVYNKVAGDRAFYGVGFEKANGAGHFTAGKFTDYVKDPLISFRMNPVTVLTAPKSGYYLEIEGFRPGAYFVTLVTHHESMWSTSELEIALKEASTMQPRAAFGWVIGYGSSEQLNMQTAAVYKFPDDRPEIRINECGSA